MTTSISSSPQEFNKECPICLTEGEKMWKLNCKHCAHLECLKGMNKLVCPICRANITNLPPEIKQNIEKNNDDYQREQNEYHDQMIRRMVEEEQGDIPTVRMSIETEIQLAFQYLASLGVPRTRIPRVNMEVYSDGPLPPQGAVFQTVVDGSINHIQQELDQEVVEEEGEEESYSSSEEETVDLRSLRPFSFSEFLGALAGASVISSMRRR